MIQRATVQRASVEPKRRKKTRLLSVMKVGRGESASAARKASLSGSINQCGFGKEDFAFDRLARLVVEQKDRLPPNRRVDDAILHIAPMLQRVFVVGCHGES